MVGRAVRGQESLSEGWQKLVGSPGGPGWVGRLSRTAGRGWEGDWRGQESHQEGLGGWEYPKRAGSIGRSTNRAGWGLEVIPESPEGSGTPPGGPGGVGRSSWRFGRGRETHPDGRVGGSPPN